MFKYNPDADSLLDALGITEDDIPEWVGETELRNLKSLRDKFVSGTPEDAEWISLVLAGMMEERSKLFMCEILMGIESPNLLSVIQELATKRDPEVFDAITAGIDTVFSNVQSQKR